MSESDGRVVGVHVIPAAAALRQSGESNGARELEAGASFFRLTGIFFQFLKDVRGVGRGRDSEAIGRNRRIVLRFQRGGVILGTHGFAAVGHALAAAADWHRMRKALAEGDPAAVGYSVRILGNSVMFAGSIMEGAAEMRSVSRRLFQTGQIGRFAARAAMRVPLFTGFGVGGVTRAVLGGWIGLLLYIVGTVLVMAFHLTPLERLIRESPFSKPRGAGGQRQRVLDGGPPRWAYPEAVLKELQNLLMSPLPTVADGQGYTRSLGWSDRPQSAGWENAPMVSVFCPFWEPGRSRLSVALSCNGGEVRLPEAVPRTTNDGATVFSWRMDDSVVSPRDVAPGRSIIMAANLDLYGDGEVIIPSEEEGMVKSEMELRDLGNRADFR